MGLKSTRDHNADQNMQDGTVNVRAFGAVGDGHADDTEYTLK
jgi:hypothetical protein